MSSFDATRSRKTYSYQRVQPTPGFVGVTTVSGGFGFHTMTSGNQAVISLDTSIFSGSGGISVVVTNNKILLSGSNTTSNVTGTLVVSNVLKSIQTTDTLTSTSSFAQMGSMSGSITINASSSIMIMFHATVTNDQIRYPTYFRALIDGTVVSGSTRSQVGKPGTLNFPTTWYFSANINCASQPMNAGAHTIAIQWAAETGSISTCNAGSSPTQYSAWLLATEITRL